MPDYTVLGQPS